MLKTILALLATALTFSAVAAEESRGSAPEPLTLPAAVTTAAEAAAFTVAAASAMPVSGNAAADAAALTVEAAAKLPNFAPVNVLANTGDLHEVTITWSGTGEGEKVKYNVFKKLAADTEFSKLNESPLETFEYEDTKVSTSTSYTYYIEAVDSAGTTQASQMISVNTGSLFFPGKPGDLRAYSDIESVLLIWSQPSKGTYEISGYNIYRGTAPDKTEMHEFVAAGKTRYEDVDVVPAEKYFYRIKAQDIEGHESKETDAVNSVPVPLPRTGLVLMDTGYRNDINNNFGFNFDMMFSYYIGMLYGEHDLEVYGKDTDPISKIGVWLLSGSAKWTLFNEKDMFPALGAGYLYTILLQDKIGTSAQDRKFQQTFNLKEKDSLIQMQGFFLALSKKAVWEFTGHAGYHVGDQTAFMAYFSKYLEQGNYSRNAYFLGLSRPLFSRMGLKVEYIVPIAVNSKPLTPDYYIVNTHIDRFINFDIGYFHFPGGFSWLGYISFRFTVFPNPYK